MKSYLLITAILINLVLPGFAADLEEQGIRSGALKCTGAWTGTVRYKRVQSMSNNKTVERVSGRGRDTTQSEMRYDYAASVVVKEDLTQSGNNTASANVQHNFTATETVNAVEKNSCDRGKTWQDMRGTTVSRSETNGNGKVDANVHVGVNNDGSYSVSVGIPPIEGKSTGSMKSTYSGQCTPKEGKDLSIPATKTSIDGNSLTSDGSHRVDPADPNRLSGSFTRSWEKVTETISWDLRRCGGELRIIDLKFEDMKFPTWNDWQEISEQKGTIDGNLIKIKAKVINLSGETKFPELKFKETYKGDKWDGARPDGVLENGETSIRLEAGEEREVGMVWDSSGYSWFDDGRPRLLQRIKAELTENGKKADEMTKNLKVAPKPLVLVHGLWSNWRAWESWQNILTTSHSYDWKAFPVGEKPEKGMMNTGGAFLSTDKTNGIFENSQELGKYVRYAQEDRNAWHVDLVAHSMGGLISRHYIQQFMPPSPDGRPQVSHLVMLGTPNMGSPCADVMNTAFNVLGKNVEAVRQLTQEHALEFNRVNRDRKGVKFSVLAGEPLPTMCKSVVWNDGVVSVPSAVWEIADNARSKNLHTDLTGTSDFSAFVKPRLAIGPKGDHLPAPPSRDQLPGRPAMAKGNGNSLEWLSDSFGSTFTFAPNSEDEVWVRSVRLMPGESTDLGLMVGDEPDLGVTFMTTGEIIVELIDPNGMAASAKTNVRTASTDWFRSIYIDKNVRSGNWKVRVKNTGNMEGEAVITAWFNAAK